MVNGYLIPSALLQSAGSQYSTTGDRGEEEGGEGALYRILSSSCNMNVQIYEKRANKAMCFPPISLADAFASQ